MATGGVITLFSGELDSGSPQTGDFLTIGIKGAVLALETDAGTVTAEVEGSVFALSNWISEATGGDDLSGQSFNTSDQAVLCGETHLQEYRVTMSLTGAASANVTLVALLEN